MERFKGLFSKYDGIKPTQLTGELCLLSHKSFNPIESNIYRVHNASVFHRGRERSLPDTMILKQLRSDTEGLEWLVGEGVLLKHKRLKELDCPVAPTLRYDNEQKEFIMTDFSEGGKKIIIDKHTGLPDTDITIANYEDVIKQIKEIALRAYNGGNGIFLAKDAYSVVVDPNTGIGKVVLIDIGLETFLLSNGMLTNGTVIGSDLIYDKERALSEAAGFVFWTLNPDDICLRNYVVLDSV